MTTIKFSEIQPGQIFCIDGTKSYPKLRLDNGYVDMRDDIFKKTDELQWPCEILTIESVAEDFETGVENVQVKIQQLQLKYMS